MSSTTPSGGASESSDRVVVLPVPPLTRPVRTRKPRHEQQVMRCPDVYRPQPAAPSGLPTLLVSHRGSRGRSGPTSTRPSRGRHPRSGNHRHRHGINLCHGLGRSPDVGRQDQRRREEKALRILVRWHAGLTGGRRRDWADYRRARRLFLNVADQRRHKVLMHKEAAHEQSFVTASRS